MPKRKTAFAPGNYYHVYNRGANKRPIFFSDDNYRFLLQRLKQHTLRDSIAMIAYCLMPNHYHLLLRQDGDVTISHCLQAVFNSYTKAINKMYGHSGTLFEGRFKSVHVDSDEYLIHLCRYIHRNPVDGEKPLVQKLEEWPYSNYLEWIEERPGKLVDRQFVKDYFVDPAAYTEFILDHTPQKAPPIGFEKYLLD